jgi:transposase
MMDFHLDALLNLPYMTVESCVKEGQQAFLKLRCLNEAAECPHCHTTSDKLNQNRPVMIRDLPISGQAVYLEVPRRQFRCQSCQRYFTERLEFVDWERRYTRRYEAMVCDRINATSIEQVSREENLSWDQVRGIYQHKFGKEKQQLR